MHHSFPNRIMPHSFSLRISAIFLTLIAFFPDISAKSLVDAQTDSLLKSHKMVFIDGQPSDSSTKAYIDSIRMVRTPPVAKMVRCESFSFLFFLICVNIY